MKDVVAKFKGIKTKGLTEISHKEKRWKENEKERKLISYRYAFELGEV